MPKLARCFVAAAALLLAISPLLPIWRISLLAPQYPEGMGMVIRLNTIEGAKENDLENINHLNHYIGMRLIEPADMPELAYMPWVVVGIAAAGFVVAALGWRPAVYAWALVFGAGAIGGMADFWWRMYTYGHTLDFAHAAIQIPGLAYQPPLIGSKQIANFTASAWPASGGIAITLAAALTLAAVWLSFQSRAAGAVASHPIGGEASPRTPAAA